jgi:alkylated DNA repair dioxygenase AlkB
MVQASYQAALFGTTASGRQDLEFGGARRVPLDAWSWVEHVPNWLAEPGGLFEELLDVAPWEQRGRWMYTRNVVEPRLTAEYQDVADVPSDGLRAIVSALEEQYRSRYRSLWLNLYRDQHDSTAWHGDVIGRVLEQCTVPVLTLGATRRFLLRPTGGGASLTFSPASGDLIVMGGRAQRDWRHCVPKQSSPCGSRISINFALERYR